jgi:Protein of unknown function (DUF2924)
MSAGKMTQAKAAKIKEIEDRIARLPEMDRKGLHELWGRLFDRPPNRGLRREMLVPILAYRIQERAFGGLKESTVRRLHELAADNASKRNRARLTMIRPKIGTRYVREYEGKLHEVIVLEAGYEYEGQIYRSLTEVAKVITGTKWSGPVFFGYKRPSKRATA